MVRPDRVTVTEAQPNTPSPEERPVMGVSPREGRDLKVIESVAWLMDHSLRVPGTPIRFGLDSLIGLVPGIGDAVSGAIHLGVIGVSVYRYRLPKPVLARMVANSLIDAGIGVVPFVGDAADVAYKAHSRNLRLLRESLDHRAQGREVPVASSRRFLIGVGLILALAGFGLIAIVASILYLTFRLIF